MLMAPSAGRTGAVDQPTAQAGWDAALLDLYASQRPSLVRLAVLLTDDRGLAEDVVQDAFLALQRRWHAVDPLAAAGYLRISVVNGGTEDQYFERRTISGNSTDGSTTNTFQIFVPPDKIAADYRRIAAAGT